MSIRRTLYLRARVRELFPPDDPVVPCLLRLMAAVNDLRTLGKLWLYAQSRVGNTPSEQEIIKAEHIYLFRLTCATLYEAAKAFQDFRQALEMAGLLGTVARLEDSARDAFEALHTVFHQNFESRGWGRILVQLRNAAGFHYDAPRVFRAELLNHEEFGDVVLGEIVGVSRYLLADDLQVQIIKRPLGADFDNNLIELSRTVGALTNDMGALVDGWVGLYLETNAGGISERRDETVDTGLLWGLP